MGNDTGKFILIMVVGFIITFLITRLLGISIFDWMKFFSPQ